jgi:hypothetical protein
MVLNRGKYHERFGFFQPLKDRSESTGILTETKKIIEEEKGEV